MPDCGFIALPGLDAVAFPIKVVELELHILHLRVFRQDTVQHFRTVVEGQPDVPGQSLRFQSRQFPKSIGLLRCLVGGGVDGVEPIVVYIVRPQPGQLLLEETAHICLFLHQKDRQLGGDGKVVTGMAVHQSLLQRGLAHAAVVNIGGVEISKPLFQKAVHHLLEPLRIDLGIIPKRGETHGTKS